MAALGMNKILIDINIYFCAMLGDSNVTAALRQVNHIGISAISIGELLSGFRGGNREQENRQEPGGCPGIAIFFKIKACSKNYRRHIVDISRIIF